MSITKILIAFISMFCLMKRFQCSNLDRISSAITYSLSSVMVMWQGWSHSEVAMYAPLLLFFIDRLICNNQSKDMIGITIFTYLYY